MLDIKRRDLLAMALTGTAVSACSLIPAANVQGARPNVLVILADDMGWTDIAPFGAEIATPNLDALARRGVRMTNFHVSPYCSPTRAMLLTGQDNHEIGQGNMTELLAPAQRGQPGYEGFLNHRAVTVAQRLQEAGYWTVMSGKWHLGHADDQTPKDWGFDRSFAMLNGEANHFVYQGKDPSPDGLDKYRRDGRFVELPKDFYSTSAFVDYLNTAIDETPADKPFFGYLAFTAPHSPLQAPQAAIAKYKGKYDAGPQALADARVERLKKMGLVAADAKPHPLVAVPAWDAMPAAERAEWSRRMEVYAAMIELMDEGVGRVVDNLKKRGRYDNTLILFLSDNGAAGGLRETNPKWGPWIKANFDNSLNNMGSGTSYISTGPTWAQASMSPSAFFKGFTSEGGTLSPVIIAGPAVAKGGVTGRFCDVKDIVPSILALAGVKADTPKGKAAMRGASFLDVVARPDPKRAGPDTPRVLELDGGRAVHQGDWKAVLLSSVPHGLPMDKLPVKRWLLFDVMKDPGETNDLAATQPAVLRELIAAYDAWAKDVGAVELPGMLEPAMK